MNSKTTILTAALIACGAMSTPALAQWDPDFKFSGFGTLGAVRANTDEGQYKRERQARGADKSGSLLVDSNLGLQLTGKANDWLSATVQTLTAQRTEDHLTTKIDWAFVKATPLDGLALRAGKVSLPNFLISDTRRVGYANTALRPSDEVYGLDLLNGGLKGADISYRLPVAGNSLTVTGLAGKSSFTPTNSSSTLEVKDVKGLNLVWDGDWYTIRLGTISGKPQIAGFSGEIYKFTGLGFTLDRANFVLQGEKVKRRSSPGGSFLNADAQYILAGYRIDKVLPYLSLAERKPYQGAFAVAPQKTTALGVRWDAFSSAAIKFQAERVDTQGTTGASFITPPVLPFGNKPITQPVTTLSVAVDFVF